MLITCQAWDPVLGSCFVLVGKILFVRKIRVWKHQRNKQGKVRFQTCPQMRRRTLQKTLCDEAALFPSHEWVMPPPDHLLLRVGFASVGAWICLWNAEKLNAWHKVGWGWLRTQDASLGTFLSRHEFSCYNSEPHLNPHLQVKNQPT